MQWRKKKCNHAAARKVVVGLVLISSFLGSYWAGQGRAEDEGSESEWGDENKTSSQPVFVS